MSPLSNRDKPRSIRNLPSRRKSLVSGFLATSIAASIACSSLLSPNILLLTKPKVANSAGVNFASISEINSGASRNNPASQIISHESICISSFHLLTSSMLTGPCSRHLEMRYPGVFGISASVIIFHLTFLNCYF